MNRDPLVELLARLPQADSDAVRSERVRARCGAALARRRERRRATTAPGVWQILAGLGCVYVAEVIRQAVLLYGLL
jgi:hypothetical protein